MAKGTYKEVFGDLIELAQHGTFDVIIHGCNCFNTMKSGIAPKMAEAFSCDIYPMEHKQFKGDINKLGTIDEGKTPKITKSGKIVKVVNCYTQFSFGTDKRHLDYHALTLVFKKLNQKYESLHLGMPLIGCGLAGGDWEVVKGLIHQFMPNVHVTVVKFRE